MIEGPNQQGFAVRRLGDQPDYKKEDARRVSPLQYVRAGLQPILTIHGNAVRGAPDSHAVRFRTSIRPVRQKQPRPEAPPGKSIVAFYGEWRKELMPQRLVLIILCLSFLPQAMAQPARQTASPNAGAILAEVSRLKGVLAALKLSAAEAESFNTLLSRSERAAQSGHIFLSLHLLQYAAPSIAVSEYLKAKTEIGKGGLPAFEQEWQRFGKDLAARQRKLAISQRLPLAVQAVIERSLTQVQPNYQASRLYGAETSVENGLYYLGLVKGQLDFVAFCRSLKFDAPPATQPLRSFAPELAELEKEVLAAYRQFDTPEQHSAFIRVNSSLKVAQDLEHERRYSGAWLQGLEARRALTAMSVTTAENRTAPSLRTQSETFRAQLSNHRADHSIGWLYWQMAEAALATDDLKQANAILHHVLPLYFKSMTRNKR